MTTAAAAEATPTVATAATTPNADVNTTTNPSKADAATSSDSFDPASIEDAFGLPAGSLKDTKDSESALAAVREYTDKVTVAGLGLESPLDKPAEVAAPAKQAGQPAAKAAEGETPAPLTKADIDKMFEDREQAQQAKQTNAMLAELQRRLDAEVDTWASPKYGVGKQRTVKQIKAKAELDNLIKTHIGGAAASGLPLPVAEVLARRVRLLDDETYKPVTATSAVVPLGTPGAAKVVAAGDKEGPRNIHEAVLGRKI